MARASDPAFAEGRTAARRVLDGSGARDADTFLAVDAALRSGSPDPVVHAAALLLAFTQRAGLGVRRSQAKRWVLGLDELITRNHLPAAEFVTPKLAAAFPRVPYFETMDLVFRRLPPPVRGEREPFVDDLATDAQLVRTPGAQTLLLAFCGGRLRLGLPLNLMDRWFAPLGCHVLYLRDRDRVGYQNGVPELGPDRTSTIQRIANLAGELGARHIVCTGNSSGGYGALRYALELGAERVLALSPITGGAEYVATMAPHLGPDEVTPWDDLVPLFREPTGVRVRMVYGEINVGDREQCLRFEGLPDVTVDAIAGWESHHLVAGLLRARQLQPVLRWLTSPESSPDAAPANPSPATGELAEATQEAATAGTAQTAETAQEALTASDEGARLAADQAEPDGRAEVAGEPARQAAAPVPSRRPPSRRGISGRLRDVLAPGSTRPPGRRL